MVKYCKIHYWWSINMWNVQSRTQTYSAAHWSKSCSLWTKCFLSLFACFFTGCVDSACWKQDINPSEAPSNLHYICNSHRLAAAGVLPPRLDPRVHTSTTNALFMISLCSIFPLLFPLFSVSASCLERTRCSQKMKLGTSCFKCWLGWFLYTNMVRSFRHTFSSLSSVVFVFCMNHSLNQHHPIMCVTPATPDLLEVC